MLPHLAPRVSLRPHRCPTPVVSPPKEAPCTPHSLCLICSHLCRRSSCCCAVMASHASSRPAVLCMGGRRHPPRAAPCASHRACAGAPASRTRTHDTGSRPSPAISRCCRNLPFSSSSSTAACRNTRQQRRRTSGGTGSSSAATARPAPTPTRLVGFKPVLDDGAALLHALVVRLQGGEREEREGK